MKIFRTSQVTVIDKYTIKNEPIVSIDLMERSSTVILKKIIEIFSKENEFVVIAGPGNNGGDGLAVARMLYNQGFSVKVFLVNFFDKLSDDCKTNYDRLRLIPEIKVFIIKKPDEIYLNSKEIIIDALFGSGLNRVLEGSASEVVKLINKSGCKIISIDIPSGLFGEDNSNNNSESIVKANYTLSLQFPKLSFFLAENNQYTGKWFVLPIGLHKDIIDSEKTNYYFTDKEFAKSILKLRETFSHKGNYGHALLISGSKGKIGAAVLSARACLRSGVGLLTTHVPECGNEILQAAVPESMISIDNSEDFVTQLPDILNYSAIGIGPGIGTEKGTIELIENLFSKVSKPLVIDADGLNIISDNKELLKLIPKNTIITPHPKEFDRLAGDSETSYERHINAISFAEKYNVYVVLKGAFTQIISPDGNCFFNSTGNPGMATGGSGDVLTGIILSFLAQGYSPLNAAILGVYIHGLAGDIVADENSQEFIIAGDLVENLGKAFKTIQSI